LLQQYPESPQANISRVALGRLYTCRWARPQQAVAAFGRYLDANPDGPLAEEALAGKAQSHDELNQAEAAAAAWQELQRRFPSSPYLHKKQAP
jgi:TolA-binding protein